MCVWMEAVFDYGIWWYSRRSLGLVRLFFASHDMEQWQATRLWVEDSEACGFLGKGVALV